MKLKHLISTSALIFAGLPANASDPIFMCKACEAGTYQPTKGSQTSCTPCPVGQYQNLGGQSSCNNCPKGQYQNQTGQSSCSNCPVGQYQDGTGASGCKTCHGNTNPTSVSGKNCGSVTVDVTGYCRAEGSTSSTANAAKVGTTTINLGNCSGNTYCSNNVCTTCSKPANSSFTSGCNWACNSGYWNVNGGCYRIWVHNCMNDRDVSSYLLEGNSFTYYDRVYDYSPDENSGFITDIDYIFLSTEEDAPSCSPDNISINSLFDCDLYERSLGGISRDVFGECTKK